MNKETYDVAVVGAGLGGIYAAHALREAGFSVLGIEGGTGVGGVWHHNAYPGARVDTDSVDYCYHFSKEIFEKWRWAERFAAQPEMSAYLNWVADELDVRRLFHFETWLCGAKWLPDPAYWQLEVGSGERFGCRFLVMCTGNLSLPKPVDFPGLTLFKGEWVQTNRWPTSGVALDNRRVAIIGTGSSGMQAVPVVAEVAERLYVFQRTPHYGIPAQNGPMPLGLQDEIAQDLAGYREAALTQRIRPRRAVIPDPQQRAAYTVSEQLALLEKQWEYGGHGMKNVFADLPTDWETNTFVSNFVRQKIRERVKDVRLADKVVPPYPIGTRRLVLESGYYEALNRDNVTMVDMRESPIRELTESGIRTDRQHYDVDLVIFALGFQPFEGALDSAGIRNAEGRSPGDVWTRGPRTVFGLMTPEFPNLFHPTNAGSPSVFGPLFLQNEFHADWLVECIGHMQREGRRTVEATHRGAEIWCQKSAAVAENLICRKVDNYMVHVNEDDGSRIFQPWGGGLATYVAEVRDMTARGYEGFAFS